MNDQRKERQQQASTILQQLGGHCFMAMVGVKYRSFDSEAPSANFSFRFGGSRKANHCKIVLDSQDTYTVTFYKIHGANVETVCEHMGIHNSMLQSLFTEVTGLYTTLGTLGE